ncbi:fungal-specific transcription factor domain-containing protein [Aspergillus multicolor]|uniref:Zn(II)2Cys6 transcription factor n=1 Tax=Aspergillus multicolor TaxID=41759 RepID=UPI003CCD1E46
MNSRNRSLTGCRTCRSRHLKCDEARPGCQLCSTLGVPCPGYQVELRWVQFDHFQSKSRQEEDQGDRVFRRPLFSEVEQENMTRTTVQSLGSQSANEALEQVDRHTHTLVTGSVQTFSYGPFGVLNISLDLDKDLPIHNLNMELLPSLAASTSPRLSQFDDPHPDLWTPTSLASSFSPQEPISASNQRASLETATATATTTATATATATMVRPNGNQEENIFTLSSFDDSPLSIPSSLTTANPQNPHSMPERAPQLIRYFRHQVVSLSYPLKGNKHCPWQTIHLPRAEQVYAELLLHQHASSTGLSLFYSLLAASCFHLSSQRDTTLDWQTHGKEYNQLSRHYLEQSIHREIASDAKVKYKELLMALLSMVMLEINNGNYISAQTLLIESECLIRKRGLPKTHKSLKVRMLHHVYTYTRIMAESTCGCALMDICPQRPSPNPSARLVSHAPTFSSLRSFRVADDSTLADLDATLHRPVHIASNDLHLEVLGVWRDSLFQEIYGIPESLLGLVSQTIRLANEQDLLHRDTTVNIDLVLTLNKRTKILEHQVLSWRGEQECGDPREDNPDPARPGNHLQHTNTNTKARERATHYLSSATHQSLILFYYRRIHNMNALILQDTVRKVFGFVRESENHSGSTSPSEEYLSASLLWPVFIAACEALEPDLQAGLLGWITAAGARTSIPIFAAAADVVRRVWELRRDQMDYTLSWFQVQGDAGGRCPIIAV